MKQAVALMFVVAACGGAEKTKTVEEPVEDTGGGGAARPDEEEEPDDGLEVESTRGKMAPEDVEAGIAPHAQALQDCYLSRVGKQKWLGGKVELKWQIARDGTLTSAQIVSADLGHWGVEKCMLGLARAMSFAKPKGGDADFTVPLELSARGNAEWWDEEKASAVVAKRVAELATCAEDGLPDPTDVTVTVYVGTRGKVQSAGFSSPALIDDAWADCAHKIVMGWTLTDPKGRVAKLAFVHRPGETPAPDWETGE
jgi:hypothetical protein